MLETCLDCLNWQTQRSKFFDEFLSTKS